MTLVLQFVPVGSAAILMLGGCRVVANFQSKNDRREALQFWREVVEGRLNPATLPVIYRARA
jgi:hypothetical protein